MRINFISIYILLFAIVGACDGDKKSKPGNENIDQKTRNFILSEFIHDEVGLFSSEDSCIFSQFVQKSLKESLWDEHRIFDSKIQSVNYQYDYLRYSFSLIFDTEKKDISFLGFGDLRDLHSYSLQKGSIPRLRENIKVGYIINRYLQTESFSTRNEKINYIHAFMGFLYKSGKGKLYNFDCDLTRFPSFKAEISSFCKCQADCAYFIYEDECCGAIIFRVRNSGTQFFIDELSLPNGNFVMDSDIESEFECQ